MSSVWKDTISSCVRDALGVHTTTAFLNLIPIFPIPVNMCLFFWSTSHLHCYTVRIQGYGKDSREYFYKTKSKSCILFSSMFFQGNVAQPKAILSKIWHPEPF